VTFAVADIHVDFTCEINWNLTPITRKINWNLTPIARLIGWLRLAVGVNSADTLCRKINWNLTPITPILLRI
jgi:hypothetical protein